MQVMTQKRYYDGYCKFLCLAIQRKWLTTKFITVGDAYGTLIDCAYIDTVNKWVYGIA
jgi:hypothetical protein